MKKLICFVLLTFFLCGCNIKQDNYSRDLLYMDTYINIKIYSNDKELVDEAMDKIDNMYKNYDQLADRYTSYDDVINIYYINHKLALNESIKIDKRLYDMLKYSVEKTKITNNLFNIALGNVIDVWGAFRSGEKKGIPSLIELQEAGSTNLKALILSDDNTIMKTENISLDLGAIAKGYVTQLAGDYLDEIGLNKYIITAGTSSIKAGDHYNNSYYKIGLTNPDDTSKIYKVISGNNFVVTTSGSYERYYEYNGEKYHHIIDPNTLFPTNYMSSVTVINDDASLGEILSTTLFLMPINEGAQYIKKFP
ncbi:MAG: FAD:protein FMN transferase, partial [Bacilli bacterium]